MGNEKENRRWVLRHRPQADITADDLALDSQPLPAPADGEVLVRNIYLSLDPTNRLWMSDRDQYLPPVQIGEVMRGITLGVVEESRSDKFQPGDIVKPGRGGWQLYSIAPAKIVQRVDPRPGLPLTAYMSVLGLTGLTAYFGLLELGQPKAGETVVITAAAGAVGSVAGQIAKLRGCRVIGIAGGAEKCRWITGELGFDGAIDYKSEDVGAALDRLCPDGVDVLFENVGGDIMDAVFSRLRLNGRVALCGLISGYNDERPLRGPTDFGRILMKRLTVRGFIVSDFAAQFGTAMAELEAWVAEGRIKWKDHVVDGLENAPEALSLLFSGKNEGKLMVRISPEP